MFRSRVILLVLTVGLSNLGFGSKAEALSLDPHIFSGVDYLTIAFQVDFTEGVIIPDFIPWTLNNTSISDQLALGRGIGCTAATAGGYDNYVHLAGDDGIVTGPGDAAAQLKGPIDLTNGPVTLYWAAWTPDVNSPRQIIRFENGVNGNSVSWQFLSNFQSQVFVNQAEAWPPGDPPAEPPTDTVLDDCGGGTIDLQVPTCADNEYRMILDPETNSITVQGYNLPATPGAWTDIHNFVSPTPLEAHYDTIRLLLNSGATGGQRFQAIAGTSGSVPAELSKFVVD